MSSKETKKPCSLSKLPAGSRRTSRKPEPKKHIQPVPSTINEELINKSKKKVTPKKVVTPILAEEKEYYPNKLKRKLTAKKVVLKPKHNFTIIAGTNKRKLTAPQKGKDKVDILPPSPTNSDLSVTEAVRIMDETRTLTDEDLMEILTCPSPVWWEDPPDSEYIEDAICRLPNKQTIEHVDKHSDTNKRSHTPENSKNREHVTKTNKTNPQFSQKQQKLEDVLGNIKKRSSNTEVNRRISESTDGDLLSDISLNEEDILRDLENISIPIEDPESVRSEEKAEDVDTKDAIKFEETSGIESDVSSRKAKDTISKNRRGSITVRKDLVKDKKLHMVPTNMPTLTRKPFITNYKGDMKRSQDCFENPDIDSISDANIRFISDDDSSNAGESIKHFKHKNKDMLDKITSKNDFPNKTLINDLSEYITVYKIMSNDDNIHVSNEIIENIPKNDKCAGELNNFFKKCKNNKRLKKEHKSNNGSNEIKNEFDSKEIKNKLETDSCELKKLNEKENSDAKTDEQNRLKGCDYCIIKNKQGATEFSCDTCKMAPCDLCNFAANTRDVTNHVSRCNSVSRIPWNNSYLLNQT